MPDISMCTGGGCPLKINCYRHCAKPDKYMQSYFKDPPYEAGNCRYFWRMRGERHAKSEQPPATD